MVSKYRVRTAYSNPSNRSMSMQPPTEKAENSVEYKLLKCKPTPFTSEAPMALKAIPKADGGRRVSSPMTGPLTVVASV
eukprot:CAMPEP_0175165702 /NCGR_PEP_ID=MMETSP0087-20121206/27247_1 /TAXON_ID=136419 /ORGANISM="Unknown Unknown, Strain D1" /LENGTH=78 /DNA_ID=CAMNT_0016455137 /DNA_START=70 /DNA_END=302 /DNA_ORIENTATION=-